ncbi:uncharacterized protein CCR75_001927 [Bremia lactucae]|uniref:MYND-type domain-containing protein n=1 Tax=Bremia lactucae TaxID=4779 RepID=A0A976FRC6_BRELC|nr:hypothetical protein CCR75_001927 [Bremia lactucae]
MGRFTVAKQCIHTGERAIQAAAFAVIVRESVVPKRCHWCFAMLRQKALQCAACKFARYCSRACLDADAALHDYHCQALHEIKLGKLHVKDLETVRLVLAVLSMEHVVRDSQALKILVTCREISTAEEEEAQHIVAFIVQMTGKMVDSQHVRSTLERVRCNAHPLYLNGVSCVGTGVFPDAAMSLNHSCIPNVAPSFNPRTRTLAFHAISEIPRGYTVESAYIDLLQSKKRRQALLHSGFGFDCICQRCYNEVEIGAETSEDDQERNVMEELLQFINFNRSDIRQQFDSWRQKHTAIFEHDVEAQFALFTVEMQLACAQGQWVDVIKAADKLLEIWKQCGLPDFYHTTETLHLQICKAAKQAAMLEKSMSSAEKVLTIRRICGYLHSEISIKGLHCA